MSVANGNLNLEKKGQTMTLEQIEKAELEAYEKEQARIDALPLIKGGVCPQCEWLANNCHCVEYGLPLPE